MLLRRRRKLNPVRHTRSVTLLDYSDTPSVISPNDMRLTGAPARVGACESTVFGGTCEGTTLGPRPVQPRVGPLAYSSSAEWESSASHSKEWHPWSVAAVPTTSPRPLIDVGIVL
jgi:hypothetical protein